jgi:serine/threonine protein kinase
MDEFVTCPICQQPHRRGARFCPTTGKPLTQPLGSTPPFNAAQPGSAPVAGKPTAYTPAVNPPKVSPPVVRQPPSSDPAYPAYPTPGSGALTGMLPSNAILNNRYLVINKIGQGGMAAVYKATDTHLPGAVWAIKEMSDAALPSPEERAYAVQTFLREAQLLRTLNHPNLPKVTDFFSQGGKQYLVMEFVPGQTLDRMLAERGASFSEAEVLNWAQQLCEVLAYLHTQNPPIIFRDLKPGNIMLTPQGQIKLIDFGIVRFFKQGKTKDTQALGTPGFFAPEATTGQTDARSDVYSLCVTLHQLLTCNDPSTSMFALPLARSLNPSVSPGMESILQRGMQMQRELRWANTLELRLQFSRVAANPNAWNAAGAKLQPTGGVYAGGPYNSNTSIPYPIDYVPSNRKRSDGTPLAGLTSRPTTRLIMAAARLSPWQLALMFGLPVVLLVILTGILAPVLEELPVPWSEFPVIAIFGALGYSAYPKRFIGITAHTLLTMALVGTIYLTTDNGYSFGYLLLGTLVSGLFIELWAFILRLIKRRISGESWGLELCWLALMAPPVIVIFYVTVSGGDYALGPFPICLAPVMGVIGWFIGDMLNQYITFRQTGYKRRP